MQALYDIVEKRGLLLFFFLWINILIDVFVWHAEAKRMKKRYFEKIMGAFFFLFGFHCILLFVFFKISWFLWILLGFISILGISEFLFYLEYQALFDSNTFLILKEANMGEGTEFVQELLSPKFLRNLIAVPILFFLPPYLLAKGFEQIVHTKVVHLLLLGISLFALVSVIRSCFPKKRERYFNYLSMMRLVHEYRNFLKQEKENKKALEEQKRTQIHIKKQEEKVDTIIFVIGESASRNYLEIYGSYFQNTPNACRREKEGSLHVFRDVISSESLTAVSVPNMLTFKNYEHEKEWCYYPSLLRILKEAGYTTYWFSNHYPDETTEKIFSSFADVSFFAKELPIEGEYYDEFLVDEGFKKIGNEKKKAIFIHLYGSHSSYAKRYPQEWAKDTIETVQGEQKKKIKQYIAEYSNSLRYTDYVLEKIISRFEEENMVCFYTSDHGEEIYETRNVRGHAGDGGSRYMVEVPMFIYYSDMVRKKQPELIKRSKKKEKVPYMTDDMIHTILGVVGVDVEGYEETRDLLSEKFDASRKRMYQKKDYDTFWKLEGHLKK